ncbi:hypothetical protein NpPPO83_00006676 [Neofusicoccum parvum]|uniref:Uncharacterized protein n=1 Tax=Neofusicoccum parvum TaxID=310453 RepID=A0ACB5SP55_9PEZI|nr:hypothetical protein NpPPO83_00006676 [Neofusicoccum parvum]
MSQPANSHQMYSEPPNIGGQAAYNPYYHQAVPNHPQQALIPVSQQHISGSSLVTGPSLANGRLPSPPKSLQNNPSASARASGAPLEEPESDRRKSTRAIQRSHLPWHHKTIPKPRWNKQNPKRCWKKFRLSMSDLKVGMIVYVIPNGEWSGDRPAIVLSLEDDRICLLCCTSFSERDIWRKYAHFADAWVAEEHKSQYVLIADGGRTRPHNFLPVVGLQQRMELPKTTYVDFYMKYECGIDDIIRFGDSQRSAVNIYVVDQPSMAAIEWYLKVRHDLMTQTEQYEARKTHYREVVGPDAARAAAARGTRMASQAGGEDFGPDVNGQ